MNILKMLRNVAIACMQKIATIMLLTIVRCFGLVTFSYLGLVAESFDTKQDTNTIGVWLQVYDQGLLLRAFPRRRLSSINANRGVFIIYSAFSLGSITITNMEVLKGRKLKKHANQTEAIWEEVNIGKLSSFYEGLL